jgi:acetyl-CoA carboxylase biotin carboxyl carrier protein
MDLSKIKDLKDLEALLDLMGRYGLAEVELEGDGQRVRLRKTEAPVVRPEAFGLYSGMPVPAQVAGESAVDVSLSTSPADQAPSNLEDVTSPLVGTFYRSSSPEAEPFVKEGDSVGSEDVLCIIEAMKVMNEVPATLAGVVREVLVKNGESVEFGQPLFRIEVE